MTRDLYALVGGNSIKSITYLKIPLKMRNLSDPYPEAEAPCKFFPYPGSKSYTVYNPLHET